MRCSLENCKLKISSITTISCNLCSKKFCLKHRLPEDHICHQLPQKCINDKKILENELLTNKCVAKII